MHTGEGLGFMNRRRSTRASLQRRVAEVNRIRAAAARVDVPPMLRRASSSLLSPSAYPPIRSDSGFSITKWAITGAIIAGVVFIAVATRGER